MRTHCLQWGTHDKRWGLITCIRILQDSTSKRNHQYTIHTCQREHYMPPYHTVPNQLCSVTWCILLNYPQCSELNMHLKEDMLTFGILAVMSGYLLVLFSWLRLYTRTSPFSHTWIWARSPSYLYSQVNAAPSNLCSTSCVPLVGWANMGLRGMPAGGTRAHSFN